MRFWYNDVCVLHTDDAPIFTHMFVDIRKEIVAYVNATSICTCVEAGTMDVCHLFLTCAMYWRHVTSHCDVCHVFWTCAISLRYVSMCHLMGTCV